MKKNLFLDQTIRTRFDALLKFRIEKKVFFCKVFFLDFFLFSLFALLSLSLSLLFPLYNSLSLIPSTSLFLSLDDVVSEAKSKGSSAASGKSVGGKKKWNLHQNLPKKEKKATA